MGPNRITRLVIVKKSVWHDDFPRWIFCVRGQHDSHKPVALIESRLDFPIQILPLMALCPNQHNGAGGTGDVLLPDLPHHVLGVIALDKAFQGVVPNRLILVMKKARKLIVVDLIATVVITDEDLPPRRLHQRRQ